MLKEKQKPKLRRMTWTNMSQINYISHGLFLFHPVKSPGMLRECVVLLVTNPNPIKNSFKAP